MELLDIGIQLGNAMLAAWIFGFLAVVAIAHWPDHRALTGARRQNKRRGQMQRRERG